MTVTTPSNSPGKAGGAMRSIGEIARLAGVTVRTLHHYHEIGLLVPAQTFCSWREMGVPLDEISRVLDDPRYDSLEVLRLLRRRLERQAERVDVMLVTIEQLINNERTETPWTTTC